MQVWHRQTIQRKFPARKKLSYTRISVGKRTGNILLNEFLDLASGDD